MRHVFSTLCKTLHHLLCTFFITSEVPSSNISTLDIKKETLPDWPDLALNTKQSISKVCIALCSIETTISERNCYVCLLQERLSLCMIVNIRPKCYVWEEGFAL